VPLQRKRKVAEIEPNLDLDEARKTLTTMCAAVRDCADFMAETTEQPIAVPEALAFFIGHRVRKMGTSINCMI
jgi:hypothetical protein